LLAFYPCSIRKKNKPNKTGIGPEKKLENKCLLHWWQLQKLHFQQVLLLLLENTKEKKAKKELTNTIGLPEGSFNRGEDTKQKAESKNRAQKKKLTVGSRRGEE